MNHRTATTPVPANSRNCLGTSVMGCQTRCRSLMVRCWLQVIAADGFTYDRESIET